MQSKSAGRTATVLAALSLLAGALPVVAQAKNGADDPPQQPIEDAPAHG